MANIKLFEEKQIRSVWNEEEQQWYFSVVDVVGILTNQPTTERARNYWKVLKMRLKKEGNETVTNCNRLKLPAEDGKMRLTDVANTKDILRIIQSIPSPKAEPFKLWLAQVGAERIEEIENPELMQQRMIATYEEKGYSPQWIEARIRGIQARKDLTDTWKEAGIEDKKDYGILTAEISKATFGITPKQHKALKNLDERKDSLRDHMTNLELILTALGEASTTEIEKANHPTSMDSHKDAARAGGAVAGKARKDLESKINRSVVSSTNYKEIPESVQRKSIESKQ